MINGFYALRMDILKMVKSFICMTLFMFTKRMYFELNSYHFGDNFRRKLIQIQQEGIGVHFFFCRLSDKYVIKSAATINNIIGVPNQ